MFAEFEVTDRNECSRNSHSVPSVSLIYPIAILTWLDDFFSAISHSSLDQVLIQSDRINVASASLKDFGFLLQLLTEA